MDNFIKLVPVERFQTAANQLTSSTVVALQRMEKVVTGKTANSIRTELKETQTGYELLQYGGESVRYLIEGKPANTKLPVQKVGDKFELFQSIKDWKAILNLEMSDYVLARAIARNERPPINLAEKSLEVFAEQFQSKLENSIISFTAQEVGEFIKKENE